MHLGYEGVGWGVVLAGGDAFGFYLFLDVVLGVFVFDGPLEDGFGHPRRDYQDAVVVAYQDVAGAD